MESEGPGAPVRKPTPMPPRARARTQARARGVQAGPLPAARRLVIGAERVGRRRSAMHSLLTVDVTAARSLMAMSPETLSFTAFIATSVARAAAEHPAVHGYRDWRGRLITHRHVDVAVPIEVWADEQEEQAGQAQPGEGQVAAGRADAGPRVMPHVVHDADIRDVADVSAELLSAKRTPTAGLDRLFDRWSGLVRIPGLVRAMYAVLDRSVRLRQRIGTVAVTTVRTPEVGEAYGIAPPTLMPLQVVIGNISLRPHDSGHFIDQRAVLNLTLTFDHDVVDGAPAARFASRLCSVIEHAEVLQPEIAQPQARQTSPSPGHVLRS